MPVIHSQFERSGEAASQALPVVILGLVMTSWKGAGGDQCLQMTWTAVALAPPVQ